MWVRRMMLAGLLLLAGPLVPAGTEGPGIGPPPEEVRRELHLAAFYKKCLMADGFAIVGSERVSDYGLLEARYLIDTLLTGRDDLRRVLIRRKIRFVVMAADELTTEVPEHSDLRPRLYWDRRARGLGPTRIRPAVSCGEENLLGYDGDPYRGENILIHEFSHGIHEIALADLDKDFDARLQDAYQEAKRAGLWKGTYAMTNHKEYWAEAVQAWFDAARTNDAQHNHVGTREQLQDYDPRLAKLIGEVFRTGDWRYVPPARRKAADHLAGYDRRKAPGFAWPPELLKAYQQYQAEQREKR